MNKMCEVANLIIIMMIAFVNQARGATVVSFPASDHNSNTAAMDQVLGITGYTFEDFGSTTLIPGLSISLTGFSNGAPDETLTALPQLYNPADEDFSGQNFTSNLWAGTYAFNNTPNNGTALSYGYADSKLPVAETTTFSFAGGARSVGIGLGNFQSLNSPVYPATDHTLYINGVAQSGTLESIVGANWTPGVFGLNAYLRIDAAPGETIDSIGFGNISSVDFLVFSHLAVLSVPEPSSLVLLCTGAVGLSLSLRSRGGKPASEKLAQPRP